MSSTQQQTHTSGPRRSWVWKIGGLLVAATCVWYTVLAIGSRSRMTDKVSIPVVNGAHSYSANITDETVPLDQFAAIMLGQSTTTLARESFIESIDGCLVEWNLRLGELRQSNEEIQGDLYADALFEEGTRTETKTVSVRCLFAPEHLETLLELQKNQTVRVRGTLRIDESKKERPGKQANAFIRNAQILATNK